MYQASHRRLWRLTGNFRVGTQLEKLEIDLMHSRPGKVIERWTVGAVQRCEVLEIRGS